MRWRETLGIVVVGDLISDEYSDEMMEFVRFCVVLVLFVH